MDNNQRNITFHVTTIENSQRKKYGDTYFHYIVESTQPVNTIKRYCTKVLYPAIPKSQWSAENHIDADHHFRNYYTGCQVLHKVDFPSDGKNKVEYKGVSPSTH